VNEKRNNQNFVQSILLPYTMAAHFPTPTWRSLVALTVIEYVTKVCIVVFTCDVGASSFRPRNLSGG